MKPLIVANWKCNPTTLKGANLLFDSIKRGIKGIKNVEVVICPPFVYLAVLGASAFAKGFGGLRLGSQDCFWEEKGAFTGEISPLMLKDLGCQYVIIGHSERRALGETDEMINRKIKAVLKFGLKPILCVGSKKRGEKGNKEILIQLEKALAGIIKQELKKIIITYEPIWAISTTKRGKIATPNEAREGVNFIRKILIKLFNKNFVQRVRIIYGGSVDSKNILGFIKEAQMAGVLVGAASLNAEEFVKAVENATRP